MLHELRVLQTVRLKGRPAPEDLAPSVGGTPDEVAVVVEAGIAAGHLAEAGTRIKLTPAGKERLTTLLAAERAAVDTAALTSAYDEFDAFNRDVKQLMTDWQLIDGTRPNDHTDPDYDAGIVKRLGEIDESFAPLLARIVAIAPRLETYPGRFSAALARVRAGDHSWFARPLVDSHHTVWFELHEELIGLAGLSRVAEAAAGRAE
jgi:hypothetical protein